MIKDHKYDSNTKAIIQEVELGNRIEKIQNKVTILSDFIERELGITRKRKDCIYLAIGECNGTNCTIAQVLNCGNNYIPSPGN